MIFFFLIIFHFSKFPALLKELKDMLGFNESGNNIEAIPMRIIKYENSRLDPEIALDIGK